MSNLTLEFKDNKILINKDPSKTDGSILDFSEILARNNIKYAIFSGCISNLLGKDGTIDGIDILIQKISFEKFLKFWLEIENSHECNNTNDPIDLYNAYLRNHHAVSIVKKDTQIPEFRIKIINNETERFVLKYRKKLVLSDRYLFISIPEVLIPVYLCRGSPEDMDEASFLYGLFKENLNMTIMDRFLNDFNIPEEKFNLMRESS